MEKMNAAMFYGPGDVRFENGGEGVGLFRTEFLYINRDELPSEEEQLQAYKKVAEAAGGKPVIIRCIHKK